MVLYLLVALARPSYNARHPSETPPVHDVGILSKSTSNKFLTSTE